MLVGVEGSTLRYIFLADLPVTWHCGAPLVRVPGNWFPSGVTHQQTPSSSKHCSGNQVCVSLLHLGINVIWKMLKVVNKKKKKKSNNNYFNKFNILTLN